MWAAKIATLRGHDVTLYDKGEELGGQVLIAAKGAGRDEFGVIVRNERNQLTHLNVPIKLGVEVTPELVAQRGSGRGDRGDRVAAQDESPVGGRRRAGHLQRVAGAERRGRRRLGDKVLLIDYDGHHQATATAEFLAELGKTVHVVTSSLFVGSELGPSQDLYLSRQRLLQKGVTFTPDFAVMEIKHPDTGAEIHGFNVYSNVWDVFSGYDSIVTAMGNDADDSLYFALKGKRCRSCTGSATAWRRGRSTWPSTRATWPESACERAGRQQARSPDPRRGGPPPGRAGAGLRRRATRQRARLAWPWPPKPSGWRRLLERRLASSPGPPAPTRTSTLSPPSVAEVAISARPVAVLVQDGDAGRQLAPLVAQLLGTGAVLSCSDVAVGGQRSAGDGGSLSEALTFVKPVYGGWLEQEIKAAAGFVPVATLDLTGVEPPEASAEAAAVAAAGARVLAAAGVLAAVRDSLPRVRHLETVPPDARSVDLVHAKRIVAAGMGTANERLLAAVHELAELLEGSVGATRPVVDEGRLPKERLIGQTGRTVAPDLYVALGISGSPHHVAGVRKADRVLSVNRDARAPIFQFSDVGYVADLEAVLPALIAKIKEWRDAPAGGGDGG